MALFSDEFPILLSRNYRKTALLRHIARRISSAGRYTWFDFDLLTGVRVEVEEMDRRGWLRLEGEEQKR